MRRVQVSTDSSGFRHSGAALAAGNDSCGDTRRSAPPASRAMISLPPEASIRCPSAMMVRRAGLPNQRCLVRSHRQQGPFQAPINSRFLDRQSRTAVRAAILPASSGNSSLTTSAAKRVTGPNPTSSHHPPMHDGASFSTEGFFRAPESQIGEDVPGRRGFSARLSLGAHVRAN